MGLGLGIPHNTERCSAVQVPVVETAGSPMPAEWKAFKDAGLVVIHKCTSIRHALRAQKAGVDAISMDGFDVGAAPFLASHPLSFSLNSHPTLC
jgi:hypothetical protein